MWLGSVTRSKPTSIDFFTTSRITWELWPSTIKRYLFSSEIPPQLSNECMKCEIQLENRNSVIHASDCMAMAASSSQNLM